MSSSLSAEPNFLQPSSELQRQMGQLASEDRRLVLVGKNDGAIRQWKPWLSILDSRWLVLAGCELARHASRGMNT